MELKNLAKQHNSIHILELDVSNTGSFAKFANDVENLVQNEGLNVLFNNAGYGTKKNTKIESIETEDLQQTFAVNTFAPILLTKALLKLIKTAANNNSSTPMGIKRAAIINMSSSLGSFASPNNGQWYQYKCSKAALNMFTKTLSNDLKDVGIIVASIHPGWVQTDMGGNEAPIKVDRSAEGIWKVMKNLNETDNGKFFQWDGVPLKW